MPLNHLPDTLTPTPLLRQETRLDFVAWERGCAVRLHDQKWEELILCHQTRRAAVPPQNYNRTCGKNII